PLGDLDELLPAALAGCEHDQLVVGIVHACRIDRGAGGGHALASLVRGTARSASGLPWSIRQRRAVTRRPARRKSRPTTRNGALSARVILTSGTLLRRSRSS